MKDGRIDRVDDEPRIDELEPERAVSVEAVARLDDRRVGETAVDLGDPGIGSVVEPAVCPDRAVDPVDEANVRASKPAQSAEVEVEGVEEAGRRPGRDAVYLDDEPSPFELSDERS